MAKKKKFYVVWDGHHPGIYETWAACQAEIAGYSNARYKSFESRAAAESAFTEDASNYWGKGGGKRKSDATPKIDRDDLESLGVDMTAWCVDAACKGNPGELEYQGVDLETNIQLFHQGPYPDGTVNIGEFLAIVHALSLLKSAGLPDKAIYSDSRIGMGWVRAKKCKTKLPLNESTKRVFGLVARAEKWLNENPLTNPLLKWETKSWGEIPADFGRK